MRRGLKLVEPADRAGQTSVAIRRFPDEEGTEMELCDQPFLSQRISIRRFPDEEGTEISRASQSGPADFSPLLIGESSDRYTLREKRLVAEFHFSPLLIGESSDRDRCLPCPIRWLY